MSAQTWYTIQQWLSFTTMFIILVELFFIIRKQRDRANAMQILMFLLLGLNALASQATVPANHRNFWVPSLLLIGGLGVGIWRYWYDRHRRTDLPTSNQSVH